MVFFGNASFPTKYISIFSQVLQLFSSFLVPLLNFVSLMTLKELAKKTGSPWETMRVRHLEFEKVLIGWHLSVVMALSVVSEVLSTCWDNKLASLEATLVRNSAHLLTYLLTGVKCRATSVAKKNADLVEVGTPYWSQHLLSLTNFNS